MPTTSSKRYSTHHPVHPKDIHRCHRGDHPQGHQTRGKGSNSANRGSIPEKALVPSPQPARHQRQCTLLNIKCILFIKINPNYKQIDPLVVVNHMMDDVHNHGRVFTRYCHRILPVERAFRAEHFRMLDELDELLTIHSQGEIRSWMLNFKCRNNNKFNYKEVLKEVENLAKKHKHFPDIYYPQWAISIEITNHLMCLSIC